MEAHLQMIIIISVWTLISGTRISFLIHSWSKAKFRGAVTTKRKLGILCLIPLSASCSTWALVPGVLSAPLTSLPPHSVTIYFKRVSPGLQRSSVVLPSSRSLTRDSLVVLLVKNLPAMQETRGSIPRSGSSSGEGNGNPLQYSYLENPTDRGAWQARVHGIEKNWTRLSD